MLQFVKIGKMCLHFKLYCKCGLIDNIVIIIIKKRSAVQGWERVKTPASQYQPIDRQKRKGKIVEDYGRDRAA